jgi:hypothetical protein
LSVWSRSLECTQNEDRTWVFGFANQDPSGNLTLATPVSFAGATAKMQIRQKNDPTSALLLSLATGGLGITLGGPTTLAGVSCGTVTIVLTNAQTAALLAGQWFYDLFVYSGGLQTCQLQGEFVVNPSVTR